MYLLFSIIHFYIFLTSFYPLNNYRATHYPNNLIVNVLSFLFYFF